MTDAIEEMAAKAVMEMLEAPNAMNEAELLANDAAIIARHYRELAGAEIAGHRREAADMAVRAEQAKVRELVLAARAVNVYGHAVGCAFVGCTCGAVETFKVDRAKLRAALEVFSEIK